MAAPFERNSCGGTHLLYALIVIRRTERPLSASVRTKLEEWLKKAMASVRMRQAADGSWLADWCAEGLSKRAGDNRKIDDSIFARLLITGHLLEYLTLAPLEFQLPTDVYRRAACWLCRVLPDDRIINKESICPRTHAVCAVRNLVEAKP